MTPDPIVPAPVKPVPYDQDVANEVAADLTPVLGGEPAVIVGAIIAVIIGILTSTGVVDAVTATAIIASAGPLVASVITRFFVKPIKKTT